MKYEIERVFHDYYVHPRGVNNGNSFWIKSIPVKFIILYNFNIIKLIQYFSIYYTIFVFQINRDMMLIYNNIYFIYICMKNLNALLKLESRP